MAMARIAAKDDMEWQKTSTLVDRLSVRRLGGGCGLRHCSQQIAMFYRHGVCAELSLLMQQRGLEAKDPRLERDVKRWAALVLAPRML